MREGNDADGDALAHAVVSVPVVFKTDLVFLVVGEVVSVVDVDLVPGDVTPDVVSVGLAGLGAESDESIPAGAVVVVDGDEFSVKTLSVVLPDEFGGHRSHEVVLEGKILSGDTELRSDLVHDSWLIAGTVPWLSELVESAAFAVLFAPFGVRSEPEDVSLVDLDHVLDGSVDLNTNGGSLSVVVGNDLVSASL